VFSSSSFSESTLAFNNDDVDVGSSLDESEGGSIVSSSFSSSFFKGMLVITSDLDSPLSALPSTTVLSLNKLDCLSLVT